MFGVRRLAFPPGGTLNAAGEPSRFARLLRSEAGRFARPTVNAKGRTPNAKGRTPMAESRPSHSATPELLTPDSCLTSDTICLLPLIRVNVLPTGRSDVL